MSKHVFLRWPEGKTKVLTFSYDDGVIGDFHMTELMHTYGMKGTFNINSARFGTQSATCRSQYRPPVDEYFDVMGKSGMEIAGHGAVHAMIDLLDTPAAIAEVMEDRLTLEKYCGKQVRGFAYPQGTFNQKAADALKAAGFHYARTTRDTNDFCLPADWLFWHPTCHHTAYWHPENALALADRFVAAQPDGNGWSWGNHPLCCYLWGHTYELDEAHNWDDIERLMERTAGKADTWYATNMEIYRYTEAFRALEYSADRTLISNWSCLPVWFWHDGETHCVKPGETYKLPVKVGV